ncbi:hypothetical protein QBC35DRAFT_474580 [Podospora australis]|uniref:Uncharacterized protein n=1 Tax=Podospora australis TaxID=1536484 RepID=A0AAN6WSK7_9PEZI|nr:hypothetical protein QBC35DRAFT_474580 [Podospora australis]
MSDLATNEGAGPRIARTILILVGIGEHIDLDDKQLLLNLCLTSKQFYCEFIGFWYRKLKVRDLAFLPLDTRNPNTFFAMKTAPGVAEVSPKVARAANFPFQGLTSLSLEEVDVHYNRDTSAPNWLLHTFSPLNCPGLRKLTVVDNSAEVYELLCEFPANADTLEGLFIQLPLDLVSARDMLGFELRSLPTVLRGLVNLRQLRLEFQHDGVQLDGAALSYYGTALSHSVTQQARETLTRDWAMTFTRALPKLRYLKIGPTFCLGVVVRTARQDIILEELDDGERKLVEVFSWDVSGVIEKGLGVDSAHRRTKRIPDYLLKDAVRRLLDSHVTDAESSTRTPFLTRVAEAQFQLRGVLAPKPPAATPKRGHSTSGHSLIRNVGLGIVAKSLFHSSHEQPKILIRQSRRVALARCAIHLLPASISIALVYFKIHGYFIGFELQGLQYQDSLKNAMLQVAAKLHELLIAASMATIVFHLLRSRLMSSHGVPLGLLASGWSFTQAGYFWSSEFWAPAWPILCSPKQRLKDLLFIAVVGLSGALAILTGPASAILMIPQVLPFKVGGSVFWLNGTEKQLWPEYLDQDALQGYNCTTPESRFFDYRCPSAGYPALYNLFARWWVVPAEPGSFELREWTGSKLMYAASAVRVPRDVDVWAYTTHTATAMVQDALRHLHVASVWYARDRGYRIGQFALDAWTQSMRERYEVATRAPMVRTICQRFDGGDTLVVPEEDLGDFAKTMPILKFPAPPLEDSFRDSNGDRTPYIWHGNITADMTDYLKNRWAPLAVTNRMPPSPPNLLIVPIDLGKEPLIPANLTASMALVLAFRSTNTSDNVTTWRVNTCMVDARWANARSTILIDGESRSRSHEFAAGRVMNLVRTELEIPLQDKIQRSVFKPSGDGSMRPIRISKSWYHLFAPTWTTYDGSDLDRLPYWLPSSLQDTLPLGGTTRLLNAGSSTLEALMELLLEAPEPPNIRRFQFEQAISMAFADGLSRVGSTLTRRTSSLLGDLVGDGKWGIKDLDTARRLFRRGEPIEVFPLSSVKGLSAENSTRMAMQATLEGYGMAVRNWFEWACIIVVLAHALSALVYTVWVVWSGRSAEAWATVPEMIALAQRSLPPPPPSIATSKTQASNHNCAPTAAVTPTVLENIGAGIGSMRTWRQVVWVEEHTAPNETEPALRLRFGHNTKDRDPKAVPAIGRVYK